MPNQSETFNRDLDNEIQSIVSSLKIQSGQRFWLIRTDSGEYYEDFKLSSSVGLNHSEISISQLAKIRADNTLKNGQLRIEGTIKDLKRLVEIKNSNQLKKIQITYGKESPEYKKIERSISLSSGQIARFTYEVKKGDYIVIPSANSVLISIGRIVQTPLMEESVHNKLPLKKSVKWLSEYERNSLDPNFFKMFLSHQAINEVSSYRDVILRTVYDFYLDQDNGHMVMNVQTTENINAYDFYGFGYHFLDTLNDFFRENDLPYNAQDLSIITNLNSPGKWKLFGKNQKLVLMAAIFVVAINGGGLEYDDGSTKVGLTTDGIIQKVIDYQNNSAKREVLNKLVQQSDSLKFQESKDVVEIINSLK